MILLILSRVVAKYHSTMARVKEMCVITERLTVLTISEVHLFAITTFGRIRGTVVLHSIILEPGDRRTAGVLDHKCLSSVIRHLVRCDSSFLAFAAIADWPFMQLRSSIIEIMSPADVERLSGWQVCTQPNRSVQYLTVHPPVRVYSWSP